MNHASPSAFIAPIVGFRESACDQVIGLLDEGATVPFIARYRKDQTGGLDEVQIQQIREALGNWRALAKRKEYVISAIREQGKCTPDIEERLRRCTSFAQVEDLYLPFKKKRKTRADKARALGLEPLAKQLMAQGNTNVLPLAKRYVKGEVKDVESALQGARDIMAEWINEHRTARAKLRTYSQKKAILRSRPAVKTRAVLEKAEGTRDAKRALKYKDYFQYAVPVMKAKSHAVLALLRGEKEGILTVGIEPEKSRALALLYPLFVKGGGEASHQVGMAVEEAYKRLLKPSMESELRRELKKKADRVAIDVFASNLRELLLAPPVGEKRVLAIDPGFRTGCKVVCLNEKGDLLRYTNIFPFGSSNKRDSNARQVRELVRDFGVEVIGIGNGTAGRETMEFIRDVGLSPFVKLYMVNEDGASIYSASAVAREEFPNEDITVRGAISIGRRLMDPLAELVKIDPKSIGVGQYQHDVDQKMLRTTLDYVVESCVNSVGVDINTASKYLLTYVSGLGEGLAQSIVDYRTNHGRIQTRADLRKIPRLGPKSYEQCAGFLRVKEGGTPLDNSAVHPEHYEAVEQMAADLSLSVRDLIGEPARVAQIDKAKYTHLLGRHTFEDIIRELRKPGLDPRAEAEVFEFDSNIRSIGDLAPEMILPGIVTNVTRFGAFVDIGIKQNGLIHISNMAEGYVSDPGDILKVNQHISVQIIEVDQERDRIGLRLIPG